MATWLCGHARRPYHSYFGNASEAYLLNASKNGTPVWRDHCADELAARASRCPACRAQDRRNRNHWAALSLAIVLALLVLCAAVGSR